MPRSEIAAFLYGACRAGLCSLAVSRALLFDYLRCFYSDLRSFNIRSFLCRHFLRVDLYFFIHGVVGRRPLPKAKASPELAGNDSTCIGSIRGPD